VPSALVSTLPVMPTSSDNRVEPEQRAAPSQTMLPAIRRTPLNAILGYTELMAEAYGEPSEKMASLRDSWQR
jgi:hypothetical protein